MRQILTVLIILLMMIACNNSDQSNTGKETSLKQVDTAKLTKHILIDELKKLRQSVASKDKENIADIFVFPLSDTSFSVYIDDSTFNEQYKRNGDKTTKSMFLNSFKEISENIWLDQLSNLLQKLPLDSLSYTDMLERDAFIPSQPCFYSYKLEVVKDSVVLRMDMNSNRNYKSKKTAEEDIPENSSEICEHSFWWNFKFDGKRLRFKSIGGAG